MEEINFVVDIFAGGEAHGLTPSGTVVTLDSSLIVRVRDVQSLNSGAIINKVCMDAIMELCTN